MLLTVTANRGVRNSLFSFEQMFYQLKVLSFKIQWITLKKKICNLSADLTLYIYICIYIYYIYIYIYIYNI